MRGITTQFIRQLSAAANQRTDGELLDGFLMHNAEADFAELVRRYGSMVWAVCRRALPDQADAEDAFQTVFLVLVRRGNKLLGYPSVGPWLHRVAVWTCRNIRRRNAHRLSKRETLTEAIPAAVTDRDLPLDLDNALLALPEKFRSSIVLCHLLGFSRADAAAQLG
ncbi:MAG TPA: sigma-70 family RNA polymerase sigma factor, partial [Gemmata sp.]|nr:sigma-70 family RNA polymerase sigma factor [Gemmata sp.]